MNRAWLAGLLLAGTAGCATAAENGVTFNTDVAPILWQHCAGCHHEGEVGPFPLVTYRDAAKRAKFIRDITASRRMPPWKAEKEFGEFLNERRLSAREVTTLAAWAAAGAPEGDAKDLPKLPKFPIGWQLGTPDLVLKMPATFTVPASGPDIYRCFVVPIPIDGDKVVAGVEFRAGTRRVVHHAGLFLDDKGLARKKDGKDGKPGYTSFGGPGFPASGRLGGWTMGAMPRFLPDGAGIYVKKGSDLVIQMHYHPSGKEESDRSVVAIYFAKKPVKQYLATVSVDNRTLKIPAGAKRHRETGESEPLPVQVEVQTVSAHMHQTGREIKVTALLPGGKTVPLVWIKDWDFHWHEVYQFNKPVRLPQGTVLKMEAYFDNSDDNPKNPNHPPKPMRYGNQLTDEMALAHLEVTVPSLADTAKLEAAKAAGITRGEKSLRSR